jgi:hypothetical protein
MHQYVQLTDLGDINYVDSPPLEINKVRFSIIHSTEKGRRMNNSESHTAMLNN